MSVMLEDLESRVESVKEEVIGWRRYLHENPELSFQEEKTSQFIYDTLKSFGGNLEITRPTPTSVVAKLKGGKPGRVLGVRADMDALPITEENSFEFKSKNDGVMHACGHDGHTAMLLGTAKLLLAMQPDIPGEVRFIFQHAEELFPGGAEEMVNAGVMEGVEQVIGIHLWSPLTVGKIGIRAGAFMAAPDTFYITVKGKGGHAAQPQETVDSIAVAAQVVTNLQHVVSRNLDPVDPAVLSVTKFVGGTTHNVIPGSVEMMGTVRSFRPELRTEVPALMERVIKGVTDAHGATYTFKYERGYRPVINDEAVTEKLRECLVEAFSESVVQELPPTMGGEDFSAYQQKAPGVFFYVGARNEEKDIVYPHHHPRFTVDETALPIGVKAFIHAVFKLNSEE
ncbi:M20 family metallopeptidase [Alicyclobacillus sp. SO9]|uniref:M20 family metallopeptidase n=1 Tax=Alicyclobacillus sp. SO9 TaxID=2665646 RepID=UPI0018E8D455|nr:M20 family metallopeptidase [Alicyclobacillus sp. SO9]QQE77123.1 amidohydrolase [Alicyclobacillus sp. SO9]